MALKTKVHSLLLLSFLFFFANCQKTKPTYDWLLLYYMPYDNDLSAYAPEIIEMIRKGTSEQVAALVWADLPDQGIHRYTISNQTVLHEIDSSMDNSADISCYNAYLNWVQVNFKFKKYAVIFLNHGGQLTEICQDDSPKKQYLDISQTAEAIQRFSKKIKQKPELTFLQVCAKGSLESHLEFSNCSNYTLCSQRLLGAPNYYYEKTLQTLSKHPEYNGKDLAWLIVNQDAPAMYDSYTCIDNQQVLPLVQELKAFLTVLTKDSIQVYEKVLLQYHYLEEEYLDLVAFSKAVAQRPRQAFMDKALHDLEVATEKAVAFNYKNKNSLAVQKYCGLFILSPYANDLSNYQHLSFFQEIQYDSLWSKTTLHDGFLMLKK